MSGPKVQMPPPDGGTADEIQGAYGVQDGPLVQEIPRAPGSPAPRGVGTTPGAKWPRSVALAYLSQAPKLPIYVPLSRDEEGRAGRYYQCVIWNGWEVDVPKGVSVLVPAPIAEIVRNAMQSKRTEQARYNRAVDMMLITPESPGGLLVEEYSDPVAVEMIRRGAPLRFD
jgi:hypothetical protein